MVKIDKMFSYKVVYNVYRANVQDAYVILVSTSYQFITESPLLTIS